jgi:carbamoyltransferase
MAPDGSLHINLDFVSYHVSPTISFNSRFTKLFGPPRDGRSSFYTRLTNPDVSADDPGAKRNQHYADVAASIQRFAEEALLRMARHAHARTASKSLCMAGGVALNSVANGRIVRETPFEHLYVQPAAGDSGGALGAALYTWHVYLGQPRTFVMEHTYWGEGYDDNEVERYLRDENIRYIRLADDSLPDYVATALDRGRVIGWMQGRFEWGPRALGHRSILADPRQAEMKEIVNTKIKFREPFRPFAPAVPTEHASAYFDVGGATENYPARFMLTVVPVHKERGNEIPAVNHFGTARIQTVDRAVNPRYYDLIANFGSRTGVPVVLNTSFNLRGEPIVSSIEDALSTFRRSGLDMLVMGSCVIEKGEVAT